MSRRAGSGRHFAPGPELAAAVASLLLLSCSGSSILLVADGDLEPGVDLDRLDFVVTFPDGGTRVASHALGGDDGLPQSLEVVASASTPTTVVARLVALLGGAEAHSVARPVGFRRGARIEERFCLWRGCEGRTDDACAQGLCTEPAVDGDADADSDADGDAEEDADDAGDADLDVDRDEGPNPSVPGSLCSCDSDCMTIHESAGVCIQGICMTRATAPCTEAGSTAQCPDHSRCWGATAHPELGGVCWPDCDFYVDCAGACDDDGSCVPSRATLGSCDRECSAGC